MPAAPSFTDTLRAEAAADWTRSTRHRFVETLGDGTLDDAVLARYLAQDYQFVGTLAALLGYGIAKAPTMAAKHRLAAFATLLTSEENTYFTRAFDALGVPTAERTAPSLWPESEAFLALLRDAGERGGYADVLSVLLPAEWIYLDWGEAQAPKAPARFEHREWIRLHAVPAFRTFVMGLKADLDALAPGLGPDARARVADRFRRMVRLEGDFFDAAYRG